MTTMTLEPSEVVDLSEFEQDSRPCVPWSRPCSKEAVWVLTSACPCGAEVPLCDPHKHAAAIEIEGIRTRSNGGAYCRACNSTISELHYWFEPI